MLRQIIKQKLDELEQKQRHMPMSEIEVAASKQCHIPLDFAACLRGNSIRLIAEVKKASPSKGVLCPNLNPVDLARTYAANGAAAISVLTETNYFQGSLEDLVLIRQELRDTNIPLLRKDFILHPYQVFESRFHGADALLLIVAILNDDQLLELLRLSHDLGMQCLVEVHDESEVERALLSGAKIIGINNRNLNTFAVDLKTTQRLRPLIPPDRIVVSESGIKSRDDIQKLKEWGVDAVLIGEALVTANDVASKMRELL